MFCRVIFDDSIRAMAASTRIRKNQERIRELKLNAINTLLDLPIGASNQLLDSTDTADSAEEVSFPASENDVSRLAFGQLL